MDISAVGQVAWMAFGRRGELLAIRDGSGVRIYDYLRRKSIFALPDQHYCDCALSPDGRFLACGMYVWSQDFIRKVERQRIDIWSVAGNDVIASVDLPHGKETPISFDLEFSPDGAWLAVVRMDGLVTATHLPTRKTIYLEQPRDQFYLSMPSCFFFPETCVLAYTYLDEAITIINLSAQQRILGLKVKDVFQLIGYGRSDAKIVVGRYGQDDYDNQIAVLDTDTGSLTPLVGGGRGYRWSPSCVTLSQGGNYLAALVFKETPSLLSAKASFSVGVWDARTGSVVSEVITDNMSERGLSPSVFSLAFEPPGGKLLVGRRDSIEAMPLGAGMPGTGTPPR